MQHTARNTAELSSCALYVVCDRCVCLIALTCQTPFFLFLSLALSSLTCFPNLQPGNSNMPAKPASNLGYTPPDGGWGWAVVLGSFISIGFSYAFPKSLTIYYKEIQEYFSVSYSQIAWVSSVMLASMYAGGQCERESGQPKCSVKECTPIIGCFSRLPRTCE